MSTKYIREGRGVCKLCSQERDLVVPSKGIPMPGPQTIGMESTRWTRTGSPVIARHLCWVEVYTPKGIYPNGFCLGSLQEANPIPTPEPRGKKRA